MVTVKPKKLSPPGTQPHVAPLIPPPMGLMKINVDVALSKTSNLSVVGSGKE
jgi:hypothetical protein